MWLDVILRTSNNNLKLHFDHFLTKIQLNHHTSEGKKEYLFIYIFILKTDFKIFCQPKLFLKQEKKKNVY